MTDSSPLRIGTRTSALARWQAEWVAARLTERGVTVELVPILTQGDRRQEPFHEWLQRPSAANDATGGDGKRLLPIPERGVFTKEIQEALLAGRIDLAVHSLKDLPTDPVAGLCLAAVPERAPVADAFLGRRCDSLDDLPQGSIVGTGSLRRRAQLLAARPDLQLRDIRGNVDTRLRKLDAGDYDAVILAEAGLRRLGFDGRITCVLPIGLMMPAVGQGALGLETRRDDDASRRIVESLSHPETFAAVSAERAMLETLQGGCLAPIAAWGRFEDGQLALTGRVLSPDGRQCIEAMSRCTPDHAERLGRDVARLLIRRGAAELVGLARGDASQR